MTLRSFLPRLLPIILLITGASGLTGCDNSGSNDPETMTYTADLEALNSSGVSGTATVTVVDEQAALSVQAEGTVAEQVHPQHIHGTTDGSTSSCPTMDADSDGNGNISVEEGAPAYGGILVPLDGSLDDAEGLGEVETFPVADGEGAYAYERSISTANLDVNEDRSYADLQLKDHAVVVHGAMVDGEYKATLPVACGPLNRSE